MLALLQHLIPFLTHPSEEERFAEAALKARRVQQLGYDVGFKFLPRFPDAPFLSLCVGRFNSTEALGSGYSCTSPADAFTACFHETLERALWIEQVPFWKDASIHAREEDLTDAHVPLQNLAGFSLEQRASLRLGSLTAPLLWSSGYTLDAKAPILIPSQLISSRYAQSSVGTEPLLRASNSNGLASHVTQEQALFSGALELIERDAFMITFFNQITPPRVDPSSIADTRVQHILATLRAYKLTADVVLLPTDMPATVVACVIRDETGVGPAFAIGAKAHPSSERALWGALVEALGVWYLARHAGLYREPLPHIESLNALERIAYWAKPENAPQLAWLTNGPYVPLPHAWMPARTSKALARRAHRQGVTFAAATLSTPILEREAFHAAMVVSPELQPLNLDAAYPYWGGARLGSVPKKYGYSIRTEPPPYPHPFP